MEQWKQLSLPLFPKGSRLKIGGMCRYGLHVITEKNLGKRKDGSQYCKDCRKAYEQVYKANNKLEHGPLVLGGYCRSRTKRHLLTLENTYTDNRGVLKCGDCRKLHAKAYYKRNSDAVSLVTNRKAKGIVSARAMLAGIAA